MIAVPRAVGLLGAAWSETPLPRSCIYTQNQNSHNALKYRIVASGTEFDRKMRQILRGPADARTTTLPKSVKIIAKEAFSETISLKSVILSENLEIIGPGAFQMSGLRRVRISA